MSYMFNLNTLFWCITMGFLALYCKIWKVIKSGIQAFNIFLGFFSVFGHSLVIVFQWSYIKQNFLYWRHWDTRHFGDGIHVDGNLGFGILDCYRLTRLHSLQMSLRILYKKLVFYCIFTVHVQ